MSYLTTGFCPSVYVKVTPSSVCGSPVIVIVVAFPILKYCAGVSFVVIWQTYKSKIKITKHEIIAISYNTNLETAQHTDVD